MECPTLTPVPPSLSTPPPTPNASIQIAIPATNLSSDVALVDRLVELINTVYTAAEEGLFRLSYERTGAPEIQQFLQNRELALAFRAPDLSADSLVGCIRFFPLSNTHGDFGMLACDPAFRGNGIGKELVQFAEEQCRTMGKTKMQCELLVSLEFEHPFKVRLQAWYKRLGYQVVKSEDFGKDYPHLAVHLMTKAELRVFEKALL
ncbi:hypothetical protein OQA88_8581 [Cercophora sp. LCS_1]